MKYLLRYTIDGEEYEETDIAQNKKKAEKWFDYVIDCERKKHPNSKVELVSVEECEIVFESSTYLSMGKEKEYYIGDPCYVLSDDDYYGVWEKEFNFKEGSIATKNGCFTVFFTAYGDGYYLDSDCYGYGVDSGSIAIVPMSLVDKSKRSNCSFGRVVKGTSIIFESDTYGYFRITVKGEKDHTFTINTVGSYDDDEE